MSLVLRRLREIFKPLGALIMSSVLVASPAQANPTLGSAAGDLAMCIAGAFGISASPLPASLINIISGAKEGACVGKTGSALTQCIAEQAAGWAQTYCNSAPGMCSKPFPGLTTAVSWLLTAACFGKAVAALTEVLVAHIEATYECFAGTSTGTQLSCNDCIVKTLTQCKMKGGECDALISGPHNICSPSFQSSWASACDSSCTSSIMSSTAGGCKAPGPTGGTVTGTTEKCCQDCKTRCVALAAPPAGFCCGSVPCPRGGGALPGGALPVQNAVQSAQ